MHKQFLAFDKTLIIMYNITILTRGIFRLKGAVIFVFQGAYYTHIRLKPHLCQVWLICFLGGVIMDTRVAVMGIIVENKDSVEQLNSLLHEYGDIIIGRMGIPYKEKGISIVSIAVDAAQDTISALSGKIGKLDGISVKTAYSNVISHG